MAPLGILKSRLLIHRLPAARLLDNVHQLMSQEPSTFMRI